MRFLFVLISIFSLTGIKADYSGRDAIFNMTPEQMVFASKLNDNNRRVYCHKFTLKQRQEAIERWKSQQESSLNDEIVFSPNDSVQCIVEKNIPVDDYLIDNNKTR